ncbi:unnamed protein product, partial [Allacma fusca]
RIRSDFLYKKLAFLKRQLRSSISNFPVWLQMF